jgi:hypothetical protein
MRRGHLSIIFPWHSSLPPSQQSKRIRQKLIHYSEIHSKITSPKKTDICADIPCVNLSFRSWYQLLQIFYNYAMIQPKLTLMDWSKGF